MTQSLKCTLDAQHVATLTLDRPQCHNAFDADLIRQLSCKLAELEDNDALRLLVLTGSETSFSAGADLNWMRSMADYTEEENAKDSHALAKVMRQLNFFSKPTIARVNGAAFGGGVGLIACCDIAIASNQAKFALSEVKLGLAPAVISPYVLRAMGESQARRYFLSGEIFDAADALRMGLIHLAVDAESLDSAVQQQIRLLLKAGPNAQVACKHLIQSITQCKLKHQIEIDQITTQIIAQLRVSREGQEGTRAFLSKRAADWTRSS